MSAPPDSAIHLQSFGATNITAASRISTASLPNSLGSSSTEPDLTEEDVRGNPWKYIGYKGCSSFLASEKDFYVPRRFTSLNIRVALALQDQVVALEERLEELDDQYNRRSAQDIDNGMFRGDREDRTALLETIAQKLSGYNSLVLQQLELEKRPSPAKPDIESILKWHKNYDNSVISDPEQAYLTQTDDLFSIVPKEKTPLCRLLKRSQKFRVWSIWHTNKSQPLPVYDKDPITYTSNTRIDRFITIIIIGVGILMLVAPMWIDGGRRLCGTFGAISHPQLSLVTEISPLRY